MAPAELRERERERDERPRRQAAVAAAAAAAATTPPAAKRGGKKSGNAEPAADMGVDSDSDSEAYLTDNDDGIYCAVCNQGDAHRRDPIVFCDGCDMTVHASCYGFPLSRRVPEGDEEWYCEACRASRAGPSKVAAASGGSKRVHAGPPGVDAAICGKGVKHRAAGAKRPRCGLCLRGGGAMKRTTDGRWAHLNCALYVPECYFHHPEGREPIDISRVPPRRRQMRCTLCRKPGGACVSCAEPGCKEAFHVTCGQEAGAALEFREGKDGAGGVTFAFCPKHAKLWREREEKKAEKGERMGFKIVGQAAK